MGTTGKETNLSIFVDGPALPVVDRSHNGKKPRSQDQKLVVVADVAV
jgi:hypothetical protein